MCLSPQSGCEEAACKLISTERSHLQRAKPYNAQGSTAWSPLLIEFTQAFLRLEQVRSGSSSGAYQLVIGSLHCTLFGTACRKCTRVTCAFVAHRSAKVLLRVLCLHSWWRLRMWDIKSDVSSIARLHLVRLTDAPLSLAVQRGHKPIARRTRQVFLE